jgi:hypothetical protein
LNKVKIEEGEKIQRKDSCSSESNTSTTSELENKKSQNKYMKINKDYKSEGEELFYKFF